MPRRSREDAARTRTSIVERAVDVSSVEGLESLSIGRLANGLGLSKSGVIGHFGSKERLQLATVEAGIARFVEEVWQPASEEAPGLIRLRALMDAWLSYLRRGVFPGGCFMTAVAIEFDDRPGPVKQRIAKGWQNWLDVLEAEVATAQAQGELRDDRPPRDIAFRLHAFVSEANWRKQLFGDADALNVSAASIDDLLAGLAA